MQPRSLIETPDVEVTDFAGLEISWDRRVLRPRPWTAEQGRWAADLLEMAPPGPVLELCCGAGQIGLLAARSSGRDLVQVDRDPVAVAYARRNAAAAGVRTEVREGPLEAAMEETELFPMVIADPPWLPGDSLGKYPDDPPGAVDGGVDGLDAVLECLTVGFAHLAPDGHLLLQVGLSLQVDRVADWLSGRGAPPDAPPRAVLDVRDRRPGGFLIHIGPSGIGEPGRDH